MAAREDSKGADGTAKSPDTEGLTDASPSSCLLTPVFLDSSGGLVDSASLAFTALCPQQPNTKMQNATISSIIVRVSSIFKSCKSTYSSVVQSYTNKQPIELPDKVFHEITFDF